MDYQKSDIQKIESDTIDITVEKENSFWAFGGYRNILCKEKRELAWDVGSTRESITWHWFNRGFLDGARA